MKTLKSKEVRTVFRPDERGAAKAVALGSNFKRVRGRPGPPDLIFDLIFTLYYII